MFFGARNIKFAYTNIWPSAIYTTQKDMKKFLFILASLFLALTTSAQEAVEEIDAKWIKAHYTKAEYMIPMRDGVKLYTAAYIPKNKKAQHPVLMTRTPYSCAPYGKKNSSFWSDKIYHDYLRNEYILVFQDVRGRFMSEGEFVNVRPYIENKQGREAIDEASDTYDTVEWLLRKLKADNGCVGVYGNSYSGFYAVMAAACGHPAIKAVSPQAPICDWFIGDDVHHNGALVMMDIVSFLPYLGATDLAKPATEFTEMEPLIKGNVWDYFMNNTLADITHQAGGRIKLWNDIVAHPDYDEWWQERNASRATKNISPSILMVGGTYDAEDPYGVWEIYRNIKANNPNLDCRIVVGPWTHGAWRSNDDANRLGEVEFSSESLSDFYQKEVEFPFFEQKLRGVGDGGASTMGALVFFSGENCWREMEGWNPEKHNEVKLYMQESGALREQKPTECESYSAYTADAANPVPYYHDTTTTRQNEYMAASQEFVDGRDDVLTFVTPVLESDMTIAGAIDAELFVTLSQNDADFVVKVIDVGPNGEYESLVRFNIMRGRYRNSLSKPEPFEAGKVERVAFELPDIAHTFMAGHRIKVQVQSSMFPLFDLNPHQFINIYEAKKEDFKPCDIKLYHDSTYPSNITLREMR